MSTDYDPNQVDWTQGNGTASEAQSIVAADFVLGGDVDAVDADALEAEAKERATFPVPPGPAHLELVGWYQNPTLETKRVYVDGQEYTLSSFAVTPKFAVVGNLQYQIGNWFLLPPDDPREYQLYVRGSTQKDGSTAGFYAQVFGHFINRLFDGQFSAGQKLPPHIRSLANWVGRRIHCEVQPGRPSTKVDPRTGRPYPIRPQIKLYSWSATPIVPAHRAAPGFGRPLPGQGALPLGSAEQSRQAGPAPHRPQAPAAAAQIDRSGLGNL